MARRATLWLAGLRGAQRAALASGLLNALWASMLLVLGVCVFGYYDILLGCPDLVADGFIASSDQVLARSITRAASPPSKRPQESRAF